MSSNKSPFSSVEELKSKLKTYVASVKFEKVFSIMTAALDESSSLLTSLIMLQSRYNKTKRDQNHGILTNQDYNLEMARITQATLDTIDELSEEEVKTGFLGQGSSVVSSLSDMERSGLEQQASLLIEKINFFRAQLPIISDIAQKFTAQKELAGFEKELEAIKAKLAS